MSLTARDILSFEGYAGIVTSVGKFNMLQVNANSYVGMLVKGDGKCCTYQRQCCVILRNLHSIKKYFSSKYGTWESECLP
jgi:hypothetical protein